MSTLADLDVAVAHWGVRSAGGAEAVAVALANALDCDRIYTMGRPDALTRREYPDIEFYDVLRDMSFEPVRRAQNSLDRVFEYALWEDVDWAEYGSPDVLVTSGSTTRAVITPDATLHVNYCHSPPRWLYDLYHDRTSRLPGLLARPLLRYLRLRDSAVDDRVDAYLANSPVIARRLWKFYGREAEVLYPPVDVADYRDDGRGDYYLHLGRLDREKGVPELVTAFEGLQGNTADTTDMGDDGPAARIVFIGPRGDVADGVVDRIRAAPNMEYRGFVSVGGKRDLLAGCRAVVFNARHEDFGIVPVEAIASGKATLARDEGFPGLFLEDGETGLLHDGSPAGIREAVERFEADPFDVDPANAEQFSRDRFEARLRAFVETQYDAFTAQFTP